MLIWIPSVELKTNKGPTSEWLGMYHVNIFIWMMTRFVMVNSSYANSHVEI